MTEWMFLTPYRGVTVKKGVLNGEITYRCDIKGCMVLRESIEKILADIDQILDDPYVFWDDKEKARRDMESKRRLNE